MQKLPLWLGRLRMNSGYTIVPGYIEQIQCDVDVLVLLSADHAPSANSNRNLLRTRQPSLRHFFRRNRVDRPTTAEESGCVIEGKRRHE